MALEIIWTKESKEQLVKAFTSLEASGNDHSLQRLSRQLKRKLDLISEYPQIYQKSERLNGVRRCILNKHYGFLYYYDAIFIYIITFLDMRGGEGN